MTEPTKEQIQWFWEQCGIINRDDRLLEQGIMHLWEYPDFELYQYDLPLIDLNNLFKYAPSYIVGINFRYFPGGVECEITYITEAGFDTENVFLANTKEEGYTEENSRRKSALALFWAIYKALGGTR